ncbi:uncharacterized protein LOC118412509 [Branchiostoma floridae]|uniref:Uncharacterized protein LOC118412509 n=1 Tax=Branchiostoma floridae TaxID=7739 RepID=A0A9J7KWX6_BRAFL|nr:uncharacterized protein LOC118412509 [Branchiostoma floridae]
MEKMFVVILVLCCAGLCSVQAFRRPEKTCQQLADMIEIDLRVERGISISEDDPAGELGFVTGRSSNSDWQVTWYNDHDGTYRMGADKKYDLFPAGLGCRPEASQGNLEPSDVCCTAECTHIIISGSTTEQTSRMTHYTLTHQKHDGRPVYASDTTADFLYYYEPYSHWNVGPSVGSTRAYMYVYDSAMSPEQIQGTWKLTVNHVWTSFSSVKATCAECREITISGSDHFQEARMTTYSLTSQINDGRPVYSSDTTSDYLYFYEPYDAWRVGSTVGDRYSSLTATDSHLYPEQIDASWYVWDGSLWVPYPRVQARCTDIDDCASSPCENGGYCSDQHNSYSCSCRSGWQGDNCEQDINECLTYPCNSGYTCQNHPGHYVCVARGLHLLRDWTAGSICNPESCADGWTCEARERGYACLSNQ